MKYAMIDGSTVTSMANVHTALAQQLSFPEWYGSNLDALHDCLTDLREETVIAILHGDVLSESLGIGYSRLCRVLSDAVEENPYLTIQF